MKYIRELLIRHKDFLQSNIVLSVLAALISLLWSGYVFGTNNNIFHLPIIADLYDLPQFQDDMFTQSLRYFSSGVWMLLAGAEKYVSGFWLFLALLLFSRAISFFGVLYCSAYAGIVSYKDRLIVAVTFLTAKLVYTYSYAGGGGIFLNYFTHSELANGLTLIALGLVLKQKLAAGMAMNGLVFFVNAFVAVWNCVPIGVLLLYKLLRKEMDFIHVLKQGVIGSLFFLLFAAPVILNIINNPAFGQPLGFNYPDFLIQYYPYHFLFSEVGIVEKVSLTLVIGLMVASLWKAGQSSRELLIIGTGYVAVYVAGIAAPWFTDSAFVFKLHLLRVSTFFHILAVMGCGILAVHWLKDEGDKYRKIWAVGLVIICSVPKLFLLAVPYIFLRKVQLIEKILDIFSQKLLMTALAGVAIFSIAGNLYQHYKWVSILEHDNHLYETIGIWAKDHTDQDAVFMLPVRKDDAVDEALFQYTSQRQVWITRKHGATAMWYAPYYFVWKERIDDVRGLQDMADKISYAQRHSIDYLIDSCDNAFSPVFSATDLCVYSTSR